MKCSHLSKDALYDVINVRLDLVTGHHVDRFFFKIVYKRIPLKHCTTITIFSQTGPYL